MPNNIYPDLTNARFDIKYHQLRILGSDVRRASIQGRYGSGTGVVPVPTPGESSAGSSAGGGSSAGSGGGGSSAGGGGGDSGVITPPTGCMKTAWGWITQSGSADPVVTYCENTIGAITWTRNGAGDYTGTSAGLFPEGRTWLMIQKDRFVGDGGEENRIIWDSVNTIQIQTRLASGANADDLLLNTSFEIRTCCDTTPLPPEDCECELEILSITTIIE